MQKNGAGLHTASSCFWDNTTDGNLRLKYKIFSLTCDNYLKVNKYYFIEYSSVNLNNWKAIYLKLVSSARLFEFSAFFK